MFAILSFGVGIEVWVFMFFTSSLKPDKSCFAQESSIQFDEALSAVALQTPFGLQLLRCGMELRFAV
jgi:hypothetical protein